MSDNPPEHSDQCKQFWPDLAAYALGEGDLSPEVRRHLDGCARCQQQLSQDVRVSQALLASAPEVTPRPELRARLLAAAERETRRAAPTPRRHPVPRWAVRAVAAAALVLLLGWNITLQGQVNQQRADIGTSRANWQAMTGLLNAETLAWYPLVGQQARGHFWRSPDQAAACLVIEGLPPPPPGQVYQIWLERGQESTNGGLLVVASNSGWKLIRDDDPSSYTSVSVTLEPVGGSAAPTGQRVLAGALTQALVPTPGEWQRATTMILGDL